MTEAAPGAPAPAPSRSWLHRREVFPVALFLFLMTVYGAGGVFLPVRDSAPNVCLPVELLKHGSLSFTPREAPFMFVWTFQGRTRTRKAYVASWDAMLEQRKASDLLAEGKLSNPTPRYYLVPTIRENRFVGIYGPGAGLSAVPYFALLSIVRSRWSADMAVLGSEVKVFASACIAGAAVAVFFTFLLFTDRGIALVAGLVFGLGTCVWAELTRSLWQQTPAVLWVALACCFLARAAGSRRFAALAGLASGLAVLCRPTLGVLLAASGIYLLWKSRRQVLPFVLGAVPPLLMLAAFNAYYLGSPFRMGQGEAARVLARELTGSDDVWSTPLWEGLAGILVSPSRGLFVFSPFLGFAVWGIVVIWRRAAFEMFRVWSVAAVALLLIASKWVAWFGGWVFGYRLIAELSSLFMMFLIPVAQRIRESKPARTGFAILAVVAVSIQALGAFAYDPVGWHGRPAYELRMLDSGETRVFDNVEEAKGLVESGRAETVRQIPMDVGNPRYRWRLWSISGGQLAWLLKPDARMDAEASMKELMDAAANEKMGSPDP